MYRIIFNKPIAERIKHMRVVAPFIARKRKPGNFVILIPDEKGERIPLTIVDSDPNEGTIDLIYQEVGTSTFKLGLKKDGDYLYRIVGPLGKPTHIEKFGTVVAIGGGVGIAPLYPIAKGMKEAGNRIVTILGARKKDLIILEKEMGEISDDLRVWTDDGSYGKKGLVTHGLQELIDEGLKIDMVLAIGPAIMMKFVAKMAAEHGLPIIVSLNPIMVDGTGMCGACRVVVGGEIKFACVDGPEFDGHQVDFDNLILRLKAYRKYELESLERFANFYPEVKTYLQGGVR